LAFFFGERRHLGGRIWHPAKSSSGVDADFKNQAMHAKSLRLDAGDSRQDGGAPLRRRRPDFFLKNEAAWF